MTSQLPKIDRWHSEPLDVHRWSDHPEIKTLCDHLYVDANLVSLEPKGNRKARRNVKDSLRVLILDLYVRWLKDSTLSTGFSKSYKDYKVGSRYNGLFISRKIVEVEAKTVKATKASLSKLTKQGLEDFALANYNVDIDKRKKKADLVAEVLKLAKNAK